MLYHENESHTDHTNGPHVVYHDDVSQREGTPQFTHRMQANTGALTHLRQLSRPPRAFRLDQVVVFLGGQPLSIVDVSHVPVCVGAWQQAGVE
jgi:hypothetical protein